MPSPDLLLLNTPSLPSISARGANSAIIPGSAASNPATPVTATPATQVVLTPVAPPDDYAAIYNKPTANVVFLRDQGNIQTSVSQTVVGKTLSSHLQALQKNTQPFSAGLFFSQAGALGRETTSFTNEARSFQVPGNIAPEKFTPDFTRQPGKTMTSANLNIRTRDGDTITINLVRNTDATGDSLSFSFVVEGELSKAEQEALDKLASKLGEVADEFFRSGTAELRGLEEFDTEVLGSFSITFSQFNGRDYDTFSYDYSVDETTNTAHLTGKDVQGYRFDISSHLTGLLAGKNSAAQQSLEQYLELIRQVGNDHDASSSSVRFMLDGLRSMIAPGAENVSTTGETLEKMLGNFATALPDFTATFTAPAVHNPSNYPQVAAMNLTMGQTTRAEIHDGRVLLQQESYYELRESHWDAIAGLERASLDTGNYTYVSQYVRESTTRTLGTEGNQIKNLFVEHAREWQRKEETFHNFHSQGVTKTGDSDEQLVNLLHQLDQMNGAGAQQHDLLRVMANSREDLFKGW